MVEHREDLVKTRTQTVNRLHVLLTQLDPRRGCRATSPLTRAADMLRQVRPREPGVKTLRRLAAELDRRDPPLDRRIAAAATEISAAVEPPAPP